MKIKENIIIIGGGLSGLTLGYLLSKRKIDFKILEASTRLGGRIQTMKGVNETPLELGATWFNDQHQNLKALLDALELNYFPQYYTGKYLFQANPSYPTEEYYIAEADTPSYRIAGGTQQLTDTLINKIGLDVIQQNSKVVAIKERGNEVIIETNQQEIVKSDKAVLCISPQLIGSSISFSPPLPQNVNALLPKVQTWMGGSIKFVLEYDQPFWRKKGYSGMIYSNYGIISEMYDHTNFEENKFGFTGFLNGRFIDSSQEERKELVLQQLSELLGNESQTPLTYEDKVWTDQYILDENEIILQPHQNNGHTLLQTGYFNRKIYLSSTETNAQFPGYMEGAILAAIRTFQEVIS